MSISPEVQQRVEDATARISRGSVELTRGVLVIPQKMPEFTDGVIFTLPDFLQDESHNTIPRTEVHMPSVYHERKPELMGCRVVRNTPPKLVALKVYENATRDPIEISDAAIGNEEAKTAAFIQDRNGDWHNAQLFQSAGISKHVAACLVDADIVPGSPIVDAAGNLLAVYVRKVELAGPGIHEAHIAKEAQPEAFGIPADHNCGMPITNV